MLRVLGGIYFGWSLGANDAANVFGTAVYTRVLKFWTAILLLAIFVMIGSVLEGPRCMVLMSKVANISVNRVLIITISAAITMTILTLLAIPSSSSQAVMGSIIGAAFVGGNPNFSVVLKAVICWVGTPIGAALIAYLLYRFADIFFKYLHLGPSKFDIIIKIGVVVSGCYAAYALGANNVANVTGVYVASGLLTPNTAAIIGGISIALGAATFSKKVMKTIGAKITHLGPLSAWIAILAQAITLHIYTHFGVPVSSSQAVVGAVAGIGLVRGIQAVNKTMLIQIGIGWVATPLVAGMLAFIGALVFQ